MYSLIVVGIGPLMLFANKFKFDNAVKPFIPEGRVPTKL